LKPSELRKFKNLLFAARTVVEGAYSGRHRSPYKGGSPEFVEYRNYNPGDPVDAIDWKVFARTDREYIRETRKETDMNCLVVLDASASMRYAGLDETGRLAHGPFSKLDYGGTLAAALAYLIVKQGDKIGLAVFDEALRRYVPPGGTFPHMYNLVQILEKQRATGDGSVSDILRRVHTLCKRRGLLIVISDFYEDADELFRALNLYRHRGFEVILFHLLHEHEAELPPLRQARFVDLETNDLLTCSPADLREDYQKRIAEFTGNLRTLARARGIEYNFIHTGTPYHQVLHRYLLKRNAL
jgi:uncharacterized protein (DUF58 family)